MEDQFSRLGVDAVRIEAAVATATDTAERACTLSHIMAMKAFLPTEAPACVIMEDDALLAHDFASAIDEAVLSPADNLIKLETYMNGARVGRNRPGIGRYKKRRLVSAHYGACGYIISRRLAERAVLMLPDTTVAIDQSLFSEAGPLLLEQTVLQLFPAACIQLDRHAKGKGVELAIGDIEGSRRWKTLTQRERRSAFLLRLKIALLEPQALVRQTVPFADGG